MAKTEPPATADVDEEPSEDTPVDEPEEQAQDDTPETPEQPTDDWEARYKALQSDYSRKTAELALLRRGEEPEPGADDEDDEDDDESAAQPVDQSTERLNRDSWELAETRYGSEAVDAYNAARRILRRAETPADFIAAFEAYHEIRRGGAKGTAPAPAATAKKGSRADAVKPTVDTNQSDAGPDLNDLENQFAEAKAKGSLAGFVHAATTAVFGDNKRK